MIVNLTEDVQWISQCYGVDDAHLHLSVYLVEADGEYVLVDTGSFFHQDSIVSDIDEVTDGSGPDELILANSTFEHTGNLSRFKDEWGDFPVVTSADIPGQIGLPNEQKWPLGQTSAVCGREFEFIRPPFTDVLYSMWILDKPSRTLFTAEAFGHFHALGDCTATSEDFVGGFDYGHVHDFYERQIPWIEYVDPPKLRDAVSSKMAAHDIDWVAPIHGNPVAITDLDEYLSKLRDAVGEISS